MKRQIFKNLAQLKNNIVRTKTLKDIIYLNNEKYIMSFYDMSGKEAHYENENKSQRIALITNNRYQNLNDLEIIKYKIS